MIDPRALDRAAEALWRHSHAGFATMDQWTHLPESLKDHWRDEARIAIIAYLEAK